MKKACMVVHSYYPDDPRLRREAEVLVRDNWEVDIVCLRDKDESPRENCGGAEVYRLPVRRNRRPGLAIRMVEYVAFFFLAFWKVTQLQFQRRYDVIHVQNLPDFLVFTTLVPKILGVRVALDLRDLVPELYVVKYSGNFNHPVVKVMQWVEKQSTSYADQVITASERFRRSLLDRDVPPDKVTVIMNGADTRLFKFEQNPVENKKEHHGYVLMYHGTLAERYGLDVAINAVNMLRDKIPGLQLHIYGQGEEAGNLEKLIQELKVQDIVKMGGFVPIEKVPELITMADLGVVPMRQNLFTDMAHSTKAFEYITMGVPVILTPTAAMVELFTEIPDLFFQPDNVEDLAARILTLYEDPSRAQRLLEASRKAYAPYAWENLQADYLALMNWLTTRRDSIPAAE